MSKSKIQSTVNNDWLEITKNYSNPKEYDIIVKSTGNILDSTMSVFTTDKEQLTKLRDLINKQLEK